MAERVNWNDDDLKRIWNYRHGANSTGYCPKQNCSYRNSLMNKSNYGDHSNTSWVVDHIVPISKGGTNSLNNLQPMHNYCNLKKSDNYY